MDKIRRNERMSAMIKILSDSPNHIFTLSYFCELFGAAKSTISEDIDLLRDTLSHYGLGELETITGASGGVVFRNRVSRSAAYECISDISKTLSDPSRVLPGGFLYYSDILSDPVLTRKMGSILATVYQEIHPDFVLTMETKGIPVALTTAESLGVPLVIARHSSKFYEGSAVNINYVSGSSGSIQTMSLARRAVHSGGRCLIVDDFLKGGGTAKGMIDLMREFEVEVAGLAFVMATVAPSRRRISGEKSLMTMEVIHQDDDLPSLTVRPSDWLKP